MFALIFLPDERNSQVGLGSSLKGASSSTCDDGHDDGDEVDDGDDVVDGDDDQEHEDDPPILRQRLGRAH